MNVTMQPGSPSAQGQAVAHPYGAGGMQIQGAYNPAHIPVAYGGGAPMPGVSMQGAYGGALPMQGAYGGGAPMPGVSMQGAYGGALPMQGAYGGGAQMSGAHGGGAQMLSAYGDGGPSFHTGMVSHASPQAQASLHHGPRHPFGGAFAVNHFKPTLEPALNNLHMMPPHHGIAYADVEAVLGQSGDLNPLIAAAGTEHFVNELMQIYREVQQRFAGQAIDPAIENGLNLIKEAEDHYQPGQISNPNEGGIRPGHSLVHLPAHRHPDGVYPQGYQHPEGHTTYHPPQQRY